jgi:small subunit ribosomal protein S18
MARSNERDRKGAVKDIRPRGKRRVCMFCKDDAGWVDYKDVNVLRRFMSDRGRIRARRVTGNCAQHQGEVAVAIKTARELALLAYSQRTVSERAPGRSGGRPGGPRGAQAITMDTSAADGAGQDQSDFKDLPEAGLVAVGAEA